MSSRDKILSSVIINQPGYMQLPAISAWKVSGDNLVEKFTSVATGIGSQVYRVKGIAEIIEIVKERFNINDRIFSNIPQLSAISENSPILPIEPHSYENIELSIFMALFAVAENGSLWVTESIIGHRVLPFICQHLTLIVNENDLVANMHEAYGRIGNDDYGYGAFIAGPSKTADIEQSLVLGAHGPRSLAVFIIEENIK
jgi:L-lactate dehydrogenase complex protein LldG